MTEKIWKLTEKGITDYNGKVGPVEEVVEVLNSYHFKVNDYLRENVDLTELNYQLEKENEQLKKENNDLKTSKEYWREKCLSKDSYNKFHHKPPIWFTQELKLTNKEVNKVAEAIEQNLKERRLENE